MRAAVAGGLVLLLAAALPPALSDWTVFLLTIAFAKSMVVLGVVLLLRGGLISFGHGLYYAAGAYAVGFLMNDLGVRDYLLLVPASALAGTTLAAAVGLLLRRYRGIFFAMLSLALSMILYTVLLKFYTVTGGTDGMGVHAFTLAGIEPTREALPLLQYYLALALSLVVLVIAWRFVASPLGYFMQAVRFNEIRVEYVGASVAQAIYFSYLVSGALGGLGGGLVALAVGQISPEFAYWTASADFVFVAVLGGTGSIFAPLLGSVAFEFVRNYAFKLSPQTWQMTLGVVLLLIIYFLPQGLWSLRQVLGRRIAAWTGS